MPKLPKTRKAMKAGNKTLLKRVFGQALKSLRQQLGLRVEDFSPGIGLTARSFHRIEAGRDPLQARYAYALAKKLRNSEVGIDWARTAHVLAAIHAIEGKADDHEFISSVFDELGRSAPRLGELLQQAKRRGDDDKGPEFEAVVQELKGFLLGTSRQSGSSQSEYPVPPWLGAEAAELSPIYFDLFVDQLQRLTAFEPAIGEEGLIKWESRNAKRFLRVFGVVRNPDVLVNAANTSAFDWSYVWRQGFQGIFVLILQSRAEALKLERALHAALIDRARQRPTRSATDSYAAILAKKLKVKSIADVNGESLVRGLEAVLSVDQTDVLRPQSTTRSSSKQKEARRVESGWSNAWFYEMTQPSYVLGYRDDKISEGRSTTATVLGWQDAKLIADQLESAWKDELQAALRS